MADPPDAADFALTGSALFRVLSANNDFNDGPVGFSPRGSSVVVTHKDPRVVTILSPWRAPNGPSDRAWPRRTSDVENGDDKVARIVTSP